ncbi:MAG: TonB-dependent receptor [Bacteroidetes bacterium]|nr:TonB-dependent receptor [Bacteroidota bacterium]
MNKKVLLLLTFILPVFIYAQTSSVKGKIVFPTTGIAVPNAIVDFVNRDTMIVVNSDKDGVIVADLPYGDYNLLIHLGEATYSPRAIVVQKEQLDLGEVRLENIVVDYKANEENIPTVSLSETDVADEGSQNISSALGASRDIFISTTSFIMSNARFRIRGYDPENFLTYMNGIPVNDLESGATTWGQWGGLNNVFYNRENRIGTQPTSFTFGGVGGAYSFDSRASTQRKQLQVSYANTNRSYRHRLMATYSTGMMKHGWALSLSASRRWAHEGYVPGTFYDGYSYYISVQKYFGNKHSINLTVVGAPTRNGSSAPATKESYNLAGTNYYNPNWGYYQGVKRNATVGNTHQPLMILTHEWKINKSSSLLTGVGFTFGKRERTALDWNNAANPRPDYYAYLPSYIEDTIYRLASQAEMRNNEELRQIDWDKMYEANLMSFETISNIDGNADSSITGKRARYIVENRVKDTKRFNFNTVYNNHLSENIMLTAGLNYQMQVSRYYKEVADLLGADFYVDVNQFAQRDFPDSFSVAQNDLNHPNRILYVNDRFGYDYVITAHHANGWLQSVFQYNHFDFFVSGQVSYTGFQRDGKMKNGLFPDNSFGKSEMKNFINGAAKAGATYKINGRNYIHLNGFFENRAPFYENAFTSPRTRNDFAPNLKSMNIYSGELGYQYRSPNVRLKANLYYTQFVDDTRTFSFYDDDERSLVNYTLTGMNLRHYGGELGLDGKIYKGFSGSVVLAMGRYTYTSRPLATVTQDNSATILRENEVVYAKGFNVGGTPQLATSFGLNYRAPQFWFLSVNLNYYDWMWLDYSPARRTESAVELIEPNSAQWHSVLDQEKLKGQFTMDLYAGYSWKLNNNFRDMKRNIYLVFNVGINNITNNRQFVTGGYEQTRFDYRFANADKFPNKYFYSSGTTYFVNVTFRMN